MPGARDTADRYFEAVNSADLDLMRSLFSDDAKLVHPSGTYVGVDAIVGFYRDVIFAFQTSITATVTAQDGDYCVVEFEGRSPLGGEDQVAYACDVFHVGGDDKILSLHIYYR